MLRNSDIREFCLRWLRKAREGFPDDAVRKMRARLGSASAVEREVIYLALAELYAIKDDVSNMLETFFVAGATPSLLPAGRRLVEMGRIMRKLVPRDLAERRLRLAGTLAGEAPENGENEYLVARVDFLMALVRLCSEDTGSPEGTEQADVLEVLVENAAMVTHVDEALDCALGLERLASAPDNRIAERQMKAAAGALAQSCMDLHCGSASELAALNLSLGILHELAGERARAEDYLGRCLADPAGLFAGDVIIRLALLAEKQGSPDKAARRIEAGLYNADCKFPFQLYNELCRIYDSMGLKKSAAAVADRACRDDRIADAAPLLIERAQRLAADSYRSEAVLCLRKAMDLASPRSAEAAYRLAFLLGGDEKPDRLARIEVTARLELEKRCRIVLELASANHYNRALQWLESVFSYVKPTPDILEDDYDVPVSGNLAQQLVACWRRFRNTRTVESRSIDFLRAAVFVREADELHAMSLLRQASKGNDTSVRLLALLLMGKLQLKDDPVLAYDTLARALETAKETDAIERGEDFFLMARACERLGKDAKAGLLLRRALASSGLRSKARAQLALARHWIRRNEPVRALALLRRTAHFYDPAVLHFVDSLRAVALQQAGDWRAAAELYRLAACSGDDLLRFHACCCLALMPRDSGDGAPADYFELAESAAGPSRTRLLRLLRGLSALRRRKPEEALRLIEDALWPTWHDFSLGLELRAKALEELGRNDEAARCLQVLHLIVASNEYPSLNGEPSDISPLIIPALLGPQRNIAEKLEFLERELRRLGCSLISENDFPADETGGYEGMAGLRKLTRLLLSPAGPPPRQVFARMAQCLREAGRNRESRSCLAVAGTDPAQTATTGPFHETNAGIEEATSGKVNTGVEHENPGTEVELLPSGSRLTDISALITTETARKSETGAEAGRSEIRDLTWRVRHSTGKARNKYMFLLANTLFDEKRFDEAAEYYTSCLMDRDCEQRTEVLHNLGITWCELDQFEQAVSCFDALLDDSPRHALAGSCLYHKGNALLELDRVEEAESCYRKVLSLDEGGPDLKLYSLVNLAHCRERSGDRLEAKRYLLEALGQSRQRGWIMLRLAALEANGGQLDRAREWKQRARDQFLEERDIYGLSKLDEILRGL